ncbi:hypothetical protein D555_3075 [Bordetella holmesii 35009]|nr:hypothetical protein D555_3075 [Bordetella holmesii 35009]
MRSDGLHGRGAQFHGFFHDPIHFVAGGQPLREDYAPRQFGFARQMLAQLSMTRFAFDLQSGRIFAALAVKQHDIVPVAQTQYPDGVVCKGQWQTNALAGGQGGSQ